MGQPITPPANDPVTLVEAKAHLRVVDNDEDTYITAFGKAQPRTQNNGSASAVDQTWNWCWINFSGSITTRRHLEIQIPKPPLIEVLSVSYITLHGESSAAGDYYVDNVTEPGWVVPAGTLTWPTPLDAINSVRVRFRAGYLSTDSPPVDAVPFDIKAGLLLYLGILYENREQAVVGTIATRLPWGSENLLRPHRVLLGMA